MKNKANKFSKQKQEKYKPKSSDKKRASKDGAPKKHSESRDENSELPQPARRASHRQSHNGREHLESHRENHSPRTTAGKANPTQSLTMEGQVKRQSTLRKANNVRSVQTETYATDSTHTSWIAQVSPETLTIWQNDFLRPKYPQHGIKNIGRDFYVLSLDRNASSAEILETVFPRWVCPIELQWPVNPKSAQFIEKAVTGITKTFGSQWESIQVLSCIPELKSLASLLKARLKKLHLQGVEHASTRSPLPTPSSESALPQNHHSIARLDKDSRPARHLAVLIHSKGLLAGTRTNKHGFGSVFPGGLGFLHSSLNQANQNESGAPDNLRSKPTPSGSTKINAESTSSGSTKINAESTPSGSTKIKSIPIRTSRAGGKLSEVLLLLADCLKISNKDYGHWLELGAAPGGMTEELLNWGARVTAVDTANMSPKLAQDPRVTHRRINAQSLSSAAEFDALLCDMNGPAENAAEILCKLIRSLSAGSLIIHTLKLKEITDAKEQIKNFRIKFENSGAKILFVKHLFHNRKEITFVMIKIERLSSAH